MRCCLRTHFGSQLSAHLFRMGVSLMKESIKHNRDGFELISSFRFPARSLVIVVEEMLLLGVV